jgi:hypothetical protein
MESRSAKLHGCLLRYYKSKQALRTLYTTVTETDSRKVSLRLIDWLVTNYAKTNHVVYEVNGMIVNVYLSYKNMLRAYSKRLFDPFKRHERIFIDCHLSPSGQFETTVAQMMFFKWAIDNGVIDYAIKNREKIKCHMETSTTNRKVNTMVKRKELSNGGRCAHMYNVKMTLSFI